MIYVKRGKLFDIQYWYTLQKRLYLKNADCQIIWQYAPCRNVYNNFILQQPFNTSARNDFPHSFSLQLQVNWGIFVLFDPLRRVGLMYINVFWYIVYHPVYKQRTKRHGGAIFFNISDTFRSQCVALSLYSCSFPGRLIHLQTTLTWPFYLYFLFRFVIDMEIVKGLRSLPP